MNRLSRPGINPTIAPLSGATRDGQPLSYSRPPSPDLAPWIARLYVSEVSAPEDHVLSCGLFGDMPNIRMQLKGDWSGDFPEGRWNVQDSSTLYFGPQSKRLPVSVRGSFASAGVTFVPGACNALCEVNVANWVDRAVPLETLGGNGNSWLSRIDPDGTPEDWCQAMESAVRQMVECSGGREPDPVTRRFEWVAYSDPSISVSAFAQDSGIEMRRLERIIRRDFGLTPKQVLRRARALDIASHLRGVSDQAEDLAVRYYDQSHLIREFTHFFGMSPRQFVKEPQPLLTLGLETRQVRRLEMIERLAPGDIRPWQ